MMGPFNRRNPYFALNYIAAVLIVGGILWWLSLL
jgi:hypothetical protein